MQLGFLTAICCLKKHSFPFQSLYQEASVSRAVKEVVDQRLCEQEVLLQNEFAKEKQKIIEDSENKAEERERKFVEEKVALVQR